MDYSNVDLLNSVKSAYILKQFFSLIIEVKTLNLIIYNKRIQNKLGICLENYKKICIII